MQDAAHPPSMEKLRLKQVHVIFRHGARTPLRLCPGLSSTKWDKSLLDPNQDIQVPDYQLKTIQSDQFVVESPFDKDIYGSRVFPGGCHAGQLTQLGQAQCFNVGRRLRNRYLKGLKFIPSLYDKNLVDLRTTNMKRTQLSLLYLISGFFNPDAASGFPPSSLPLIFRTADTREEEILFPNLSNFQTLKNWESFVHDNMDDLLPGYLDTMSKFTSALGMKLEDFEGESQGNSLIDVRDALVAQRAHRLDTDAEDSIASIGSSDSIDSSSTSSHWGKVRHLFPFIDFQATQFQSTLSSGGYLENRLVLKMAVGPLWKLILENMIGLEKPLVLLSGHDTTLMPLLRSMDIFNERWPPYCADIAIELYQDETVPSLWVQVLYCGVAQHVFDLGQTLLPFAVFAEKVGRFTMTDEEMKDFKEKPRTFSFNGKLAPAGDTNWNLGTGS